MALDDAVVSEPPLIVWADPGLTTGLASYDMEPMLFSSGQYDKPSLIGRLKELDVQAGSRMMWLGWEDYITVGGPQSGTSEYSDEVIGALKDFARDKFVRTLKPQPSSARKLGSKVFLRRLGWYKPGHVHANDASMHLLAHLLRMSPIPQEIRESLFPGYVPGVTIGS